MSLPAPEVSRPMQPRFGRLTSFLSRPRILTYLGVALSVGGFVLIAVAWGKTAGVANLTTQIPDVIAAGLTGVALVVLGVLAITIDAHQVDAAQRRDQAEELRDLLGELRAVLGGEPR